MPQERKTSMYSVNEKLLSALSIALALMGLCLADKALATDKNPSKKPSTAMNPCAIKNIPIRKDPITDPVALKEMGERLWVSTALGASGASCSTCHPNGAGLKKEPFPRFVKMTGDIVTMDQMINFCMVNPMKGKPLPWNSQEMTALAAYITANSMEKATTPANPCAMKNPCGAR